MEQTARPSLQECLDKCIALAVLHERVEGFKQWQDLQNGSLKNLVEGQDALRQEVTSTNTRILDLGKEFTARIIEIHGKFNWLLGLVIIALLAILTNLGVSALKTNP